MCIIMSNALAGARCRNPRDGGTRGQGRMASILKFAAHGEPKCKRRAPSSTKIIHAMFATKRNVYQSSLCILLPYEIGFCKIVACQ